MHLFMELKDIGEDDIAEQFANTSKNGFRFGENMLEVVTRQLPALSELAKVMQRQNKRITGNQEMGNAAAVGSMMTSAIMLESLYTRSLDRQKGRSNRARIAIKNLQEMRVGRLTRVFAEYYADLASDLNSPDFENTAIEYPGLYTLGELIRTDWEVQKGDFEEGEVASTASLLTVASIRELEKDLWLEGALGPRQDDAKPLSVLLSGSENQT